MALFLLSGCGPRQEGAAEPTPTASVTVDPTDPAVVEKAATEVVVQLGFDADGVKVNKEVSQKTAKAVPAGSGVFSDTKLTTPAVTAAFVASGSPASDKVVNEALASADAYGVKVTKKQLKDADNWVAVTTTEKVAWNGNTYLVGGTVREGDAKVDRAGSVAMVFIAPSQIKAGKVTWAFFLRGACGNPQLVPPAPAPEPGKPGKPASTPTPTPGKPNPTCPPGWGEWPNCLKPKGSKIPKADPPPAVSTPRPIGSGDAALPTRPARPDPTPDNGLPVHEVNPPAVPAQPDSGSGATNTVAPEHVPEAPAPPAPAPPSPTTSGIVESD